MKLWFTLAIAAAATLTVGCSKKPAEGDSPLAKARTVVETRCKLRWNLLLKNPAAKAGMPPEMAGWSPQQIDTLCRCQADGAAARISLEDLQFYVKETDFRQDAQRTMREIEKSCHEQTAPGK